MNEPERVVAADRVWSRDPDADETPIGWSLAVELGRPHPTCKAERERHADVVA